MKHFTTEADAIRYAETRRNGDEVYGLGGSYIVCTPEEADELHKAGVNLTIASPDDDLDESMDGDHESALRSVYGDNSGDFEDVDFGYGGDYFE